MGNNLKKKMISLLTAIVMILGITLQGGFLGFKAYADDIDLSKLPPNVAYDKKDFDTIPSLIKKYDDMNENRIGWLIPANGEKKLRKLNFLELNGVDQIKIPEEGVEIELPEEITRVIRFFGNLRFDGSINKIYDMTIITPEGKEVPWGVNGGTWNDADTGFPVYYAMQKMLNLTLPFRNPYTYVEQGKEVSYKGYKLKIRGEGSIKEMYLWEEQGLSLQYDITAYTVLGSDKPIVNSKVDVDATKNLSLNGTNKVDESDFKRYHVNSGPLDLADNSEEVNLINESYVRIQNEYGFLPGRGAVQFGLLSAPEKQLPEDTTKPGYADYSLIYTKFAKNQVQIDKMNKLFPTVKGDYMVVMDKWPTYMNTNPKDNAFGTPKLDCFDAAAELAGKNAWALTSKFGEEYAPKYFEVKNEPTIPTEWTYHSTDPTKSWDYLADFHNRVAKEIKEQSPTTLVGGPCSAFMYLEKKNFADAYNQIKLIDATKDNLDFYSHHLYENNHLITRDMDTNPDGFLSGRFEAVFGLLGNHMENTDAFKPIMISEEGNYNTGNSEIDFFIKLKSYNGYMLRFLSQADKVKMVVPYLYPLINWRPDAANSFFKYNDDRTAIAGENPVIAYVDMWKDYRGMFIPSSTDNDTIYTMSALDGNKIYVAYENTNNQRANLNLNVNTGDAKITKVTRKHCYLEEGKLVYENVDVDDISNIYTRVEETGVIEIELDKVPEFTETTLRKEIYGNELLLDTGKEANFTIDECETKDLSSSILRVCYGRSGKGFNSTMTVNINGKEYTKDLSDTNKSGDLLTYADFEVPTELIKETNNVTVLIPEGAETDAKGNPIYVGKISNVELINDYHAAAPQKGVDTNSLKNSVKECEELLNTVKISKDGEDVFEGRQYVDSIIADSFKYAIRTADIVAKDAYATDEDVKDAEETLQSMTKYFKDAMQDGKNATKLEVSEITLDQKSAELVAGDDDKNTVKLNATVVMNDGLKYLGKLAWTSSDDSIVTVDSEGNVTAVKEGKAVVTVTTDDGKKAECAITVTKKANDQVDPEQPSNPDKPNKPTEPTEPNEPTAPEKPNSDQPTKPNNNTDIPKTGSSFIVSPFMIAGLISLAGACICICYSRKRRLNK